MSALETEFKADQNSGLDLPNFVWLLKCAITHPPEEKYELVNGLIKLFNDIDINGDKQIEWHEFTQYIIDAVIVQKGKMETKEVADTKNELDLNHVQRVKIEKAYSKGTKEYVVDFELGKELLFVSGIEKMLYSKVMGMLVVLQRHAKKLRMLGMDMMLRRWLEIPVMYKGDLEPGSGDSDVFILDFHISEEEKMVKKFSIFFQFFENPLILKKFYIFGIFLPFF